MLKFERVDVIVTKPECPPDGNPRILVCWELVTQHNGLDQTTFTVERSQSPGFLDADEIVEVETGIQGIPGQLVYEYVDVTVGMQNWWRKWHYRVRADTEHGAVYSDARTWETQFRPHELAIIERHDLVLQYLQGIPSFIFIERTYGSARCDCYDITTGRQRRSGCRLCLGTGRQRPYFAPIPTYVDYNPDEQLTSITSFGEMQAKDKDCWLSAIPIVKPGDLIYEVGKGQLWRIVNIKTVQPMGSTVQQVCRLTAQARDDIEYQVLLDEIPDNDLKQIVAEWEEVKQERLF